MIDCSKLHGRMRQICEGVDDEGLVISVLPGDRVAYLKAFLPDADETEIVTHVHMSASMPPAKKKIEGLGDLVAAGIKKATLGFIKPCEPCKQRQKRLNEIVPFNNIRRSSAINRPDRGFFSAFRSSGGPRFISSAQFQEDIKLLMGMIPHDITAVAGIARSGLSAATMISMYLHLPMLTIRQTMNDVVPTGNGWRLGGSKHIDPATQRVLVVDDTSLTGNSLKAVRPLIQKMFQNVVTAVVYCNPNSLLKPDIWAVDLSWPHILEWNMFNSILSPTMAVDFDGILCRDCPPGHDDDGEKYIRWMHNAMPLYTPRRCAIPLIVTARLEKYRAVTEEWLERHRIKCDRLVMHPAKTLAERNRDDIAAYKAQHYMSWGSSIKRRQSNPLMFVESDDRQAQRIHAVSRLMTVCPATGGVYQ